MPRGSKDKVKGLRLGVLEAGGETKRWKEEWRRRQHTAPAKPGGHSKQEFFSSSFLSVWSVWVSNSTGVEKGQWMDWMEWC